MGPPAGSAPPPPPSSVPPPIEGIAAVKLPPGQTPNPAYKRLYQTYESAYGSIDQLRRSLDPAVQTMHTTDAWLGPEARQWDGRLIISQRNIKKAADQILWDIYNTLAATKRTT